MLPSYFDLQYFLELYRIQNFSRAAERLGITQPSLSLAIKRVEESLDVKLFNRSKSGAKPTKEADALAKDIETILDLWKQVGEKAKDATKLVKGNIKIGSHPSVALYAIKPWIKDLTSNYKDLSLSFEHDLSRKIAEQVISFKLDMGIVINPIQHPDLVILPLLEDQVTLRKAKDKTVDIETLIYDPDLNQVQSLLQTIKKKKIIFKRHVTTSSLELAEQLVSLGVGVGILPGKVCKTSLIEFNNNIKPFKDQLCLIYRSDVAKTKSFDVVVDKIKTSFNR